MKASELEVGQAYILPRFRTTWHRTVAHCLRAVVVEKDRFNGGVIVDIERSRGVEREAIRCMQLVAPWSEIENVQRRQDAYRDERREAERERQARHDMVTEMVGRLDSLSADDIDVSWDGERVTLALGAFLGMAGLAAQVADEVAW